MKSFKNYIAETRMVSHNEITGAIAAYKKAGEILNPQYKDLNDQARRIFGTDSKYVREIILSHFKAGNKDAALDDLYYGWPHDSFVSLNKAEKLLKKVTQKDVVSAAEQVLKIWKPIAADLKDLKAKVVKVTQKRAEAKTAAAGAMARKFADSSSLIKIFESHMQEYIKRARDEAHAFVAKLLDNLKKHDWDLDKVAPYPNSRTMSANEYRMASNKRSLYKSITKSKGSVMKPGDPYIVSADPGLINHYVEMNAKGAEEAYRNFMAKMIEKIGKPVIDAVMTGNIWTNATLTVTTDDGQQQVWSTKMILNFSKYQKMFNQFPSRRKK